MKPWHLLLLGEVQWVLYVRIEIKGVLETIRVDCGLKNGPKTLRDTSPKTVYRWQITILEEAGSTFYAIRKM